MKTAEEWYSHFENAPRVFPDSTIESKAQIIKDIEAIQSDARHSAMTEAAASVDLEEELEGDMPVAILAALARSPETVFRANVRATKASIKRRILAARDYRKGGG